MVESDTTDSNTKITILVDKTIPGTKKRKSRPILASIAPARIYTMLCYDVDCWYNSDAKRIKSLPFIAHYLREPRWLKATEDGSRSHARLDQESMR